MKIIGIIGLILAVWSLLDIWKRDSVELKNKILLTILVLLFNLIGVAVYYFIIRPKL